MNMMTSSGLLGRYLTDWTGPDALVRAHELRLGRPNYAGDTMRLTGSVQSAELVDGRGLVTVAMVGVNSLGNHTDSSITVELPL
jgi:acyl dehydratase